MCDWVRLWIFGCPVYNYTNMCFVSKVLLIRRSERYKAPIWIIVQSHAHAHTRTYKSIHNPFWQSLTEQHAHQSSPCRSPAPLQGADVWGQLTASANFCVQCKQRHSALLAAKTRSALESVCMCVCLCVVGALSQCKATRGWDVREERVRRVARRGKTVGKFLVPSDICCCVGPMGCHYVQCAYSIFLWQ